jgi:uncharacterized protein
LPNRRILIVGGSTRAAADSVRRAGWEPVCADLFADLDLRMTAEVIPVQNYPESLPDDVAHVRADGWFFCGALENSPKILEQILKKGNSIGPLLGTPPDGLGALRNPEWLAKTLTSVGLKTLSIANQSSPPVPDGTWLQKPLASAGGRMIRVWDASAARNPFPEPHYFQQIASGIGASVIFRVCAGNVEWLGSARELEAPSESAPPTEFSYCGSFGPINELPATVEANLTKTVQALVDHVPLLEGFVGLDFRFDGDEVRLVEVNPRYTASIELLELSLGRSLLNPQVMTGGLGGLSSTAKSQPSSASAPGSLLPNPKLNQKRIVAKQILYASESFVAPDLRRFVSGNDPWTIPLMADIPVPGTFVERGWPICTVLTAEESFHSLESNMKKRSNIVWDALRKPGQTNDSTPFTQPIGDDYSV